ncbi:MAG: PAS domain-containing protein [Planctomycetota bacterium]|jgi:PAS domain S-box-containing protein
MNDEGANNPEANPKRSALGWVYLLIVFVSAVILGSMGYVYYVGNSMVAGQAPLIDAAMEIKLEATTAHLWFEEIMSGDRHENIEGVLVRIDRAEQYARVMLEGSESGQGTSTPLRDHDMRAEITEVRIKLAEFRRITLARWETRKTSAAGTELDQKYDAIFKNFVKQADNVETELRRLIERQLRSFQIVQIVLIGLCLSVTVLIGIAFGRFVRRRMEHERELGAAYEQLHRSEQKFRYIAEQSIVGLIITQDGRFKYANQAASEILEYPVEEMLNWNAREGYIKIVHPSDRALVTEQERRKDIGDSGAVVHYAWKALTKRGRTKCVETYWKPISFQGKGANLMTMIDITERDRAEKAFKRSEKHYRELVASISSIVWECDANTIEFSFVSKEAERLLGYPVRRWIKETGFWQGHIHEDDRQWTIDYCTKATTEKRDHELEYRMIAADGRTVWLRDIVHVVVENNEPVKLRGIMTDITERKLVEEEIVNLAKFPAESPDPVLRIASDGTILYHNEASEALMEFWRCLQDVPVPDIARTCIEEALNSGKVIHDEVRCCDKVFSLTFAPVGEAGYVNVYAHDITERKRAEELLRTSEANYRAIFASANDAIFIHDIEKGEILDFNPKMSEIFGYTRAEAQNFTVDDLSSGKPGYTQKDALEWIRKAADGTPQVFEWQCRHKSGRLFRAEVSLKRARIGGQDRMLAIVRDITDRKA